MKNFILATLFFTLTIINCVDAQSLKSIELKYDNGIVVQSFNRFQTPGYPVPLATFLLNGSLKSTNNGKPDLQGVVIDEKVKVAFNLSSGYHPGLKGTITFTNISGDTLRIGNVVPFGESDKHIYITGKGNHGLSRAHLFRPGYNPVNVIVPDNAWELGFATLNVDNGSSICALARRNVSGLVNAVRRRFETELLPAGSVSYDIWMDSYVGTWQEGVRLMFNDRKLYDVEPGTFNNELYERTELKWIQQAYVGHFVSAWDNHFYSHEKARYTYPEFQQQMKRLYGGDDYNIIWHGFPMLGIDQRNQWDMFRDLPGGITAMRELSQNAQKDGTSIMTCYLPWDLPAANNQLFGSTRYADPLKGLAGVISDARLRGVMYDTRSESAEVLQKSVEKVRPDFVVFPEGMSVPSAMQNCVVGRVHAALTYAPMLNLNKLVKPDFTIFKQSVITKEPVKRDFATSFFNGYGVEIHLKVPYQLTWLQELYTYLGKTTRILRENHEIFSQGKQVILMPTTTDSVWVNGWFADDKTIYTIYSTLSNGYNGLLFEVDPLEGYHFVDIWNNVELQPKKVGGKYLVNIQIAPFDPSWAGTDNEGENGCVARFQSLIDLDADKPENLVLKTVKGDLFRIWKGDPSYATDPVELKPGKYDLAKIPELTGYNGKLVIQLFQGKNLIDQRVVNAGEGLLPSKMKFVKPEDIKEYRSANLDVVLHRQNDLLTIDRKSGARVEVVPKYLPPNHAISLTETSSKIKLLEQFGNYEGEFIIRLFDGQGQLMDQCEVFMPYGYPRIAEIPVVPNTSGMVPDGMVKIPAGEFTFRADQIGDWELLKHPMEDTGKVIRMNSFLIDRVPVTNRDYFEFINKSGYQPADSENFLKHWIDDQIPTGEEDFPVVYVNLEDARAYAAWAGKRLPSELEWQYAAQGSDGRLWPWGNERDTTGTLCNPGNGIPGPVGKYPDGANQFGIHDLTGSVWQITNDEYKTGVIDFYILKGGSYFTPLSSWWYVKGGPLPLINRQQQYRVSPGYERAATVGFRCVK